MKNHKWLAACCLGASLLAGGVQADASGQHPQPEAVGHGKRLPFAQLINELDSSRIVFVGETHDRYDHHLNQLAILRALHQRNPRLAIGVEWFQQPFQPVVDAWLAGKIDENELLRKTGYFDRWRYDYRMLRPIMEYARANHIPVMALNAPAELTRKVSRMGLQGLGAQEQQQLPAHLAPPDPAYRSRLEKIFAQHAGEGRQIDNFMLVQRIWDETMAQNIWRFLQPNPDWRMVVFSGSGHISHGAGIPDDLARQMPGVHLTTLLSSDRQDVQPGEVDYFLLTQPQSLPPTGKLGVWLDEHGGRLQIGEMAENSAARRAGLQTGDQLTAINGKAVRNMCDLMLTLANYKPGQRVKVAVEREGAPALPAYDVTLQ
jgi:uncharacterized iron-regulated protein